MTELQNETREETLRLLEWERTHTTREKPPYYNVEFSRPLDHQSFVEGVECEAVGICPSNRSDFLSYLWETQTKSLFWKPRRRLLFLVIMWYHFWTWTFWILYIASVGVLGTTFFMMESLLWYLKIVVFLAFVVVSFLLFINYFIEYFIHIEYQLFQRLTSACVSDKWLYLEVLEKKLFKLVSPAHMFAK